MVSKFRNKKYKYKGIVYDSKSEVEYLRILEDMLRRKEILGFTTQVRYKLPNMEGALRMAYIADFVVEGLSGTQYIIDVKGLVTPEMKVKMAYAQYVHSIKIHIVYNRGLAAFRTDFIL